VLRKAEAASVGVITRGNRSDAKGIQVAQTQTIATLGTLSSDALRGRIVPGLFARWMVIADEGRSPAFAAVRDVSPLAGVAGAAVVVVCD
jgi:hypothetical protein